MNLEPVENELVVAGFMPASKFKQRIFWILNAGVKARGYEPGFGSGFITLPALAQQRPLLNRRPPRLLRNGALVTETGFCLPPACPLSAFGLGGDEFQAFDAGLHLGWGRGSNSRWAACSTIFLHIKENGSGNRNDWGDFSLSTKNQDSRRKRRSFQSLVFGLP